MGQPWGAYYAPAPYPAPFNRTARLPRWTVPLLGLLSGLFAALQVVVSVSAAVENHSVLAGLYYGAQQGGFDPTVAVQWLAPMLVATYGSCLVAFAISMGLCWYAGRLAAGATGRRSAGAGAGLLTSVIGSAIWIVASIIAVSIVHTDGSFSGLLATTPRYSTANLAGEITGLVIQEVVAAALALGFGALAGTIGAGSARPWPPVGPAAYGGPPMPPVTPAGMPYLWSPQPMPYPPPPEFYRPFPGVAGGAPPAGTPPAESPPGEPSRGG